jgi:hypothetical protein
MGDSQLDPYSHLSLPDRLQLLAFEAELAHLPRSLVAAIWIALDSLGPARVCLGCKISTSSVSKPRAGL